MNVDEKLVGLIKEHFKNYPSITCAKLFGSRARGDNLARSDYDIAIFGNVLQVV